MIAVSNLFTGDYYFCVEIAYGEICLNHNPL